EPGERIDGAKVDWDWSEDSATANSSDGNSRGNLANGTWNKAVTLGRGARRYEQDAPNNWQLMADPLPAMEMTEVPAGKVVRASGIATPSEFPEKGFQVAAHRKASVLLDNGQLTTGFPVLAVSGGQGSTVRVTYAEALVDD